MNWPEDLEDISLTENARFVFNPLWLHFPLKRKASSEHNVQVMSPKGHWVAFPATLMHSSLLSIVVNREKPFPCFPRHALSLFLLLLKGSSRWLGSQGLLILVSQVSNALTFLSRECWQNPNGLFTFWQLNVLPKVNRVVVFFFYAHVPSHPQVKDVPERTEMIWEQACLCLCINVLSVLFALPYLSEPGYIWHLKFHSLAWRLQKRCLLWLVVKVSMTEAFPLWLLLHCWFIQLACVLFAVQNKIVHYATFLPVFFFSLNVIRG